jgi:acyl-CoA reductase-like NAD-dependent aldehyde dehydrogenase
MSTNEFLKEHKYVILGAFGFVILALVIITVGYGCIHAIDAQNAVQRARIEADERAREAETQRKEDEAKAASEAEVKRQGILDACLQDAHELYTLNWNLGNAKRPGYFLEPFVYQVNWGDKPYLKQEVFGPHVAIVPFKDADDAIRIYNDTEYGLAVGILTNDFRKARKLRDNCDFGLGYWNGGSIAAESHLPFGGVKKSGNGFPSAAGMFDAVVHKVSWSVNHGGLSFPQGLK